MKRLLIIQNVHREGPGLLAPAMAEAGVLSDMRYTGHDLLPATLQGYAGLVVLGGPASANDCNAAMHEVLRLTGLALEHRLPVLGICLGMQVLAKAGGGRVVRAAAPEIGFRDRRGDPYIVRLTPEGRRDPLFAGLPEAYRVFQLHGETVGLSPRITLLATGDGCRHQVIRAGDHAWGIQSHFELTPEMFDDWLQEDADLRRLDAGALRKEFKGIRDSYDHVGMRLMRNFLRMVTS